MTAQIYAPRMRQIPSPCGKDCPGREAECSARCCNWTLYESIRNHIYDVNHRDKISLEPDSAAIRQIERAANKDRRGKSYAAK